MRRLCGGFQSFSSYTWTACEVYDSYGRERLWPEKPGPTNGSCHLPLAEGQNGVGTGRHRRTAETNWGFKRQERNLETRKAWWQGAGHRGRGIVRGGRKGVGGAARGGWGGQLLFCVCRMLLRFLSWQVQGWPENPPPLPLFPSSPLQCEEHPPQAKPISLSSICFNNT